MPYIGIDEKQFHRGHCYISSLVDLQVGRVLDVVEDCAEESCKTLIEKSLTIRQRRRLKAVALGDQRTVSGFLEISSRRLGKASLRQMVLLGDTKSTGADQSKS
jgi:hypothetical protein